LSEASPQPLPGTLEPGVLDRLTAEAAGDRLRLEQYLDFVRCRTFRRSVLCHAAARPDRAVAVDRISAFAVSFQAKPQAAAPSADPAAREEFAVAGELQFATADPVLRAVLWRVWEARPAAVPFADLLAAARTKAPERADLPRELADGILQLYLAD